MIKLIAAWALALLLTAFLAHKIMTPKESAPKPQEAFSLASVQIAIEAQFETVDHLPADEFMAMDKNRVLVFDTRPMAEYAVSHIDGAVQLDPTVSAAKFAQLYGDKATGKTLVFYCSVGHRSSDMAERVASERPELGPIYNLRGGLFDWHNQGRPVVNEGGPTDTIHPYNKDWGQLVTRQDTLSYE